MGTLFDGKRLLTSPKYSANGVIPITKFTLSWLRFLLQVSFGQETILTALINLNCHKMK